MMVIKSNIAYRLAVITGLIGFIIISLARFLAVWLTAQADPAQGFASHLFLLLLIELRSHF